MEKIAYSTGTYDLVHEGHFKMLEYIKLRGYNKIIIGLVTDEFAEKRKRKTILSYEHRKSILENSKYNVYVVPCIKSDKIYDYKLLKFDSLFITDEYYNTDEYNDFSKMYPNIPVYYLPRYSSSISSTKIISKMLNNIDHIDKDTIIYNDSIIKTISKDYMSDYEYINNILRNVVKCKWYIDNSMLIEKSNGVLWWVLPSKKNTYNDLSMYNISYNGHFFLI